MIGDQYVIQPISGRYHRDIDVLENIHGEDEDEKGTAGDRILIEIR